MSIIGDWDVVIKTPVGSLHIVYQFVQHDGEISGSAAGTHEVVALSDISTVDNPGGQRVGWKQSVTRPLRLNLEFDVLVNGDRFSGHSRAGRLPRSEVTATRQRAIPR